MYAALLADVRLYDLLQRFDEDLAAEQRARGCPRCGGVLHSARYPRKPRGFIGCLNPEYGQRLSFCCSREGCRSRATPPSLRFLGRKVYLGAVVVLISALRCGVSPARMRYLKQRVGVSWRTLVRWRKWWCKQLIDTLFWRAASAALMPPVAHAQLPASLLERFAGALRERLISALRFMAPLTTESATMHAT